MWDFTFDRARLGIAETFIAGGVELRRYIPGAGNAGFRDSDNIRFFSQPEKTTALVSRQPM
ncbi:MAG: hypothetical protein HC845_13620 [Akkermansiaceae bacterium]|nr:hypothetical protein [Akkermansiaceae bacterium]